ncbi:ribonucleoside-triphosphate reductase [Candidatus Kaiserbacteria bacterium]|nr:MAG: ribonucleoside-triphosphate reductase [Candidatus Kaiserbacteria bacterium]
MTNKSSTKKKAGATPKQKASSVKKKTVAKKSTTTLGKYNKFVPNVRKRNGKIVPFDFTKIERAISKAMAASEEGSPEEATMVAHRVISDLVRTARKHKDFIPSVEGAQDEVERQLILSDYVNTAKSYILYRAERSKLRYNEGVQVPDKVKKLVAESAKYFANNPLGEFVYLRTYARWIKGENRRETWIETVDRYINFMRENLGKKLSDTDYAEVREAILKQEIMPSMRLMQFAGDAVRRCNVAAYNCSFIAPTQLIDFAEIMYLSMCGTGVGYSVESQNIQQLPQIKNQTGVKIKTHIVGDSKEGWCDALTLGLKAWYDGNDVDFDYSLVRPAGARLKIMGGKSSGPDPLRSLLGFARERILKQQGRRLRNIDAHDIICKIGECVVAGGVRRSAMISLSDLDDDEVRDAKKGQFYMTDPHRAIANNSAVYEERPGNEQFMDEWIALMKSGTGERGIFNRGSLLGTLPERRVKLLKEKYKNVEWAGEIGNLGVNPCGEIILQSKQFCNLSEVICRKGDNEKTLLRKARLATILGTYQSSLNKFNYLSKEWTENCAAERLLGVSLTGQWDCDTVRKPEVLRKLKAEINKTNKKYATKFGIPQSSATTCVKPSGTVSQTFDCASGMHPRNSAYYIRRIRISSTDSLFKLLKDQGVPYHPEVGQTMEGANTFVFEFPVKAPKGAILKDDITALDQLKHWKDVKINYTEHNPSVTVSVGDDEWIQVANWVYENWAIVGGLSFLPRTDHVYQLAPYEAIDKATYERLYKTVENIDYSKLLTYEQRDETDVKRELACAGNLCEIEI